MLATPSSTDDASGQCARADGAASRTFLRSAAPSLGDCSALAGLVLLLAFLWGRGRDTWYWIDEALSIGISSHPLAMMPELLRQDTSPPLYHVLLRGWMLLFGSSEASTHTLSLLFALAAVVAAFWAGWSLFGRRTGWMCACLAAVSPFLAAHANETRMYSLVVLLSVLVLATFIHAFVFRRRRYVAPFAIVLAMSAYTHYWALFLALGMAAAVAVCVVHASDRRAVVLDAALAFGAVGLLFAPWLPILLYQRAHSAIPWSLPPTIEQVRDDVVGLVGGPVPAAVLALAAGTALVVVLRRPWDRTALAVGAAAVVVLVALSVGVVTSRGSGQWNGRYLAVVLAPILIALGVGLARAGPVAVASLAVVAVLTGPFAVRVPLHTKSNIKGLVDQMAGLARPGDLVFAPIGAVPLLAHYLPPGLRYATTTGPVADPLAADWRDAMERLGASQLASSLPPLLDRIPIGGHVFSVCSAADGSGLSALPEYIRLEIRRCLEGQQLLLDDPQFQLLEAISYPPGGESSPEVRLLRKLPPSG
ncbi:MAG TPA: glycosyltransferase family 39 protein [Acidimicrobiales bacterium]|nr:glycosyltransferase family 39 protein [Acidimicrobiales bacterium]